LWVGWHHHVTVVLACYTFLVAEQVGSFPSYAWSSDCGPFESTTQGHLHDSPTAVPMLFARAAAQPPARALSALLRSFMPTAATLKY
jgi:hypothetical protein